MDILQGKNKDKDSDICEELSIIQNESVGTQQKYLTYCQVLDSGDSKILKSSTKNISFASSLISKYCLQ